ncbi:MAG: GNAT family N-acetyltransferase [Propionibacteriaceae bacterium]
MQLTLTVRDFEPEDLSDMEWSGGPEHITALAEALQASFAGDVAMVVVALPNGRLIANGGVDFRKYADAGLIWMLSVHETFQGMGVGTRLIQALEDRVVERGVRKARMGVEHDNPRAAALYRRRGYREVGSTLESWATSGGRTYVTVCTVLERDLRPAGV